jgi:hypothetical protein
MRIRTISLLAVFAIVLAACGDPDTTPNPDSSVDAVLLSYTLEPGTTYEYEVEVDQNIDLTTSGDAPAMGEEDMPGQASINIAGTTAITHTIAEGPEPGTFAVTIKGDFSDLEVTGTVDGEPVDGSEIPEMAEMEPIDVTVIVDEQGNIIPDDSAGLGEDFLGDLGGMNMLEQFGSSGPGQFIFPPFTEEEVTVGDTWSDTIEVPTLPEKDPITTQVDSEVTGTDTVDGHDVFVIDTTTTTSPIEFDLAEMLAGFMTAFLPEAATPEEQAEIDALIEELRFAFSVDESVGELTTWFDYEEGLARQADYANSSHLIMDVNVPDEATGDMVGFGVDMTIGQDITYRLVSADTA